MSKYTGIQFLDSKPLETPEQIAEHLRGLGFVGDLNMSLEIADSTTIEYYYGGGFDLVIDLPYCKTTILFNATPENIEQFINFFKDDTSKH